MSTKRYRITETRYFDNRTLRLHQVGDVVEIPADEKPARSWVEIKDEAQADVATETDEGRKGKGRKGKGRKGRSSDESAG